MTHCLWAMANLMAVMLALFPISPCCSPETSPSPPAPAGQAGLAANVRRVPHRFRRANRDRVRAQLFLPRDDGQSQIAGKRRAQLWYLHLVVVGRERCELIGRRFGIRIVELVAIDFDPQRRRAQCQPGRPADHDRHRSNSTDDDRAPETGDAAWLATQDQSFRLGFLVWLRHGALVAVRAPPRVMRTICCLSLP